MKKFIYQPIFLICVVGLLFCFSSCREDLLEQVPAGELSSGLFWKTAGERLRCRVCWAGR